MGVGKPSYTRVHVSSVTEQTLSFTLTIFNKLWPFGLGIHLLKMLFLALAGQGDLLAAGKSKVCPSF